MARGVNWNRVRQDAQARKYGTESSDGRGEEIPTYRPRRRGRRPWWKLKEPSLEECLRRIEAKKAKREEELRLLGEWLKAQRARVTRARASASTAARPSPSRR